MSEILCAVLTFSCENNKSILNIDNEHNKTKERKTVFIVVTVTRGGLGLAG